MNKETDKTPLNWLFLDLNSFFATCEQQENPLLRGKPIIVVPVMTDSTCAIAASYEAKAFGIKTGTRVWEAKKLCPDLILVPARQKIYTDYHKKILAAVNTCIPVEKILSIDEVACRLIGRQRQLENAINLALQVKNAIRTLVGECFSCSVGLAPNVFLGKVGSDLQKPDGLVVLTPHYMPHALLPMRLRDIYGIGPRMEARLNIAGIKTTLDLWQASSSDLRRVWGGIQGVLFYQQLHGVDIMAPSSPYAHSISHQHVLELAHRSKTGARQFAHHLLTKAGERLRRKDYYCRRLGVFLKYGRNANSWWQETDFHETQATDFLLGRLEELWRGAPDLKPVMVGVVLMGLVPSVRHQPDLFATNPRQKKLTPLIDVLNEKYGRNTVGFGKTAPAIQKWRGHAAFQRVPESWEF